jgi:antitoxin component YwqK of YwqJK toxin-antitoxin module
MKKPHFLLILLSLFLFACTGSLVEEVVETLPDGTPKLVKYYKEDGGVRDLVKEIQYYPNHNKFYEGEFKDNKKDGKWKVWYENGNLWSEGSYKAGLDEGKRTAYFENGKVHFEGQYTAGEMTGRWVFYDETGKKVNEIDYDLKKK